MSDETREALAEYLAPYCGFSKEMRDWPRLARRAAGEIADAVLSSGLVVPVAIHKVATDALEAGDACGAVGCRALAERDAAWDVIEKVRTVADYWANADGEGATERDLTAINTTNRLGRALHTALDTTPRA